jgi:hypothetical protein
LSIQASNGITPDATQSFTLTVNQVASVALPAKQPSLSGALTGVPTKSTVGQSITVSGSGYRPGAPIELGWYGARTPLANTIAGVNGAFTVTLVVPNQTGSKTLVASGLGADGNARYLGAATVVNPNKGHGALSLQGAVSTVLPGTSAAVGLGAVGATYLLVGLVALYLARRPSTTRARAAMKRSRMSQPLSDS